MRERRKKGERKYSEAKEQRKGGNERRKEGKLKEIREEGKERRRERGNESNEGRIVEKGRRGKIGETNRRKERKIKKRERKGERTGEEDSKDGEEEGRKEGIKEKRSKATKAEGSIFWETN